MKKLTNLTNKLSYISLGFLFTIIWIALIKEILPLLLSYNIFTGGFTYTKLGLFVFACIIAPLWEEAAFRHAPLQLAKSFKEKLDIDLVIPIVILSSMIFGWGHGNQAVSIIIQGVGGFVLSAVYIKTKYSYWSSVFTHFLWNFSLLFLFPSFTSTYGVDLFWHW